MTVITTRRSSTLGRRAITLAVVSATLLAVATGSAPPAAAEQASQPAAVVAGSLDAGTFHTCSIVPAASLRCWGSGVAGALGYGATATIGDDEPPAAAGPVDVGAGRTVQALSAGLAHTCALLDGGSVRCWGFGANGRLGYANSLTIGDDEPPAAAGPVALGTGRTAKAVSAGGAHSCAVLDDGTVRCWGFNTDGRLGYGRSDPIGDTETPGSLDPVRLGAGRGATAITTGGSHTCALLDDGSVRCWGYGADGQLGYGSIGNVGDDETPDLIGPVDLGAGRTAVAIAAGDLHTCAVLDDGNVRCWGSGADGRLGYGNLASIGDTESPAAAGAVNLGIGRSAVAITAGASHTCALLDDASVRCWGLSRSGQLGYASSASIGDDETPATAGPVDLGTGRTAVAISAGGEHTCARLDDDSIRCWGRGLNGELGSCGEINVGDDETPASAGPVDLGVPGVPAAACVPLTMQPPPLPAPPPSGPPPPPPPVGPPPPTPSDPLEQARKREADRAAGLRACRASVTRRLRDERARARRLTQRAASARALRQATGRAAQRRRRCLAKFGRTPGRVTHVTARASGRRSIVLTFRAAGSDGSRPPVARRYLVKQSRHPIRGARSFARADALCDGGCRFAVTQVGAEITLTVTDLRPRATYHYAVAARDNVSARPGPRSRTVAARTR